MKAHDTKIRPRPLLNMVQGLALSLVARGTKWRWHSDFFQNHEYTTSPPRIHSSQYVPDLAHVNTLTGLLVGGYAPLRHAIAHQCLGTSRSCTTVALRTAGRLQLDRLKA